MYDREIKNELNAIKDRITKLEKESECLEEVKVNKVDPTPKAIEEKVKELSEPKVVIATEEQKEEFVENSTFEKVKEEKEVKQ